MSAKTDPQFGGFFKDLSQCFQVSFLAGRLRDKPIYSLTKLTARRPRALEEFILPLVSGSHSSSKGTRTLSGLTSGACRHRTATCKECTARGGGGARALVRKPSWAQFSMAGVNCLNSEPHRLQGPISHFLGLGGAGEHVNQHQELSC